jgi:acyl carrier protein
MSKTVSELSPASAITPAELELAQLIVSALNMDIAPESIDPNAPLYRDGLGLDSIDILEVSLVISKRYGVKLRADDQNNGQIFRSLRNLNEHVQQQRPH